MRPGQAISVIESAYRLDSSTQEWLQELAAAGSRCVGASQGTIAFTYDASDGTYTHVRATGIHGFSPEFIADFFNQNTSAQANQMLAGLFKVVRCRSMRKVIAELGFASTFGAMLDSHAIGDMLGLNGTDPSGKGCVLLIAHDGPVRLARAEPVWLRLAAHISAGQRLRSTLQSLAALTTTAEQAEAVLSPNGKIEHATGLAQSRHAREALQNALVRIDAARAERDDVPRTVELWRGLVAGRGHWSNTSNATAGATTWHTRTTPSSQPIAD